ncbi:MAG: hypothetical protein NWE92_10175 [Candidatus Bathyarchaeota archaeon]|nr:hypothetical protein [Candidatus Bathyarchaeota archaeon]
MPTGFPELDKLLDEGIVSPSCICISGQSNLSQRNFLLQMICNFLQKGLKGLYVCLDRPAAETKKQFKRLGLDIDAYDRDYSLFFVDLFTYSQNALIESPTLQAIEYTPDMLINTLGPFLDWIKNGFIIIDTLTTLTLNMNSKEAYDFVRQIKLLGRAFNLIIVGAMYKQMAETDSVMTNSDGNIVFKDGVVTVANFEHEHNDVLIVSAGKDGKIFLKVPPSEVGNDEVVKVPLLSVLSDVRVLKSVPTLSLVPSYDTGYIAEELPQKMEPLIKANNVTQTPSCSTIYCPNCNSLALEFFLQCPECQSRVHEKGYIIEHFKCGNVDFEGKFTRGDTLFCEKCNKELKQLGVDYRRVGVGYRCSNKHFFSIPKIVFVCAQCREQFDLNEGKLQTQFSYELTDKGKQEAMQPSYNPA